MNKEQEKRSRSLLREETIEMLPQVHQDALWLLEDLGVGCKQPMTQGGFHKNNLPGSRSMTRIEVKPTLETSELARLFGGKKSPRFSHNVKMKVEKLKVKLSELLKPLLYYRRDKIEMASRDFVHLSGGLSLRSRKLSKSMENCEEIVCFIATVGNKVESQTKRLMEENRLSEAYILDAMGSVAVENMVEKFHRRMMSKYEMEGKGVTLPFSPGYCDWPLSDQKKLFSVFDLFHLKVKLTDSCLMLPRKSISGVFGVIPSCVSLPVRSYNPCSECEKRDCIVRRSC
ncbi:MAG: vitamin B12 dependent-methionine synthase activation domain-containing protein [Desulfobacteraceae bacterium]|jgi:hypothetical protein